MKAKVLRFEAKSFPSFEFYFSFLSPDYPFRLFVFLYSVLVNIRKRKKFKKGVLRCNRWEERVSRKLKGKFHPSYLNFCPAFVALEREKFLGQSSPNVQIPSNFPLASLFEIISRFEFSLGYLILPREEKKRRSFPPYYLIFHCQRVEYACLSFPPPPSLVKFQILDALPYNFQM